MCEKMDHLPEVAGRRATDCLWAIERRAKIYIQRELDNLSPDTALIDVMCETVRLCREITDMARRPLFQKEKIDGR